MLVAKVKNTLTLQPGAGEWIPVNCKLNNKYNNDFLYPAVFNSIINRNLMISKFSPQAGATRSPAIYVYNSNNFFVQTRKGDSVARLISLEVRGVGQPNKGLMFLGIIAVMVNPVDSNGNFNTLGYDCSNPKEIKVYDAEARCRLDPELPGEQTTVKFVQLVENEELRGFKCRVTSQQK